MSTHGHYISVVALESLMLMPSSEMEDYFWFSLLYGYGRHFGLDHLYKFPGLHMKLSLTGQVVSEEIF